MNNAFLKMRCDDEVTFCPCAVEGKSGSVVIRTATEKLNCRLEYDGNALTVTRLGELSYVMRFAPGEKCDAVLGTPYGKTRFTFVTDKLKYSDSGGSKKWDVEYSSPEKVSVLEITCKMKAQGGN